MLSEQNKSLLVKRIEDERKYNKEKYNFLISEFAKADTIKLDYDWYLHGGLNNERFEAILGNTKLVTGKQDHSERNRRQIKAFLKYEAGITKAYLKEKIPNFNARFLGYYMGEQIT